MLWSSSVLYRFIGTLRPLVLPSARARSLHSSLTTLQYAGDKNSSEDMPIEMDNPFTKEKMECILCKMKIDPDYKNVRLLSQFVSPFTGRVYGRHITGLCKKKQDSLVKEILKSQNAGFMPYYNKEPDFLEDPKLFNPERPIRNHDF